jgi:non-ribosomal peptide synthetase component F
MPGANNAGEYRGLGYFDFYWQPAENPVSLAFLGLEGVSSDQAFPGTKIPIFIVAGVMDALAQTTLVFVLVASPVFYPWYAILPIAMIALVPRASYLVIVVAMTAASRIVAPFVNLVPFFLDLSAGTFADLCRRTFVAESELLPHRRYPMADLKKRYGGRDLFDTVFNFTHFHVYRRLRALSGDVLDATGNENTYFPFTVQANMNEDTGALGLAFDYQTNNFTTDRVREIAAVYQRVLERMARWPEQRHETVNLLAGVEKRQMRQVEGFEGVACIHEIFEAQARKSPKRIAVTSGQDALSYGQLNARAEQVAAHLAALGVGPEVRVGLCLDRSTHLVVAILGVLKAAAAYVPLDPDYPPERLSYLLADSGVKVVLTERKLLDRLPPTNAGALCVEDALDRAPAAVARPSAQPENAAYVIYTSGSTGNPKGVVVEHRQVAQLLSATQAIFHFDKDDVWTLFHSSAFDFSVWEMWGALLYGGRLSLLTDVASVRVNSFMKDSGRLNQWVMQSRCVRARRQAGPRPLFRCDGVEPNAPLQMSLSRATIGDPKSSGSGTHRSHFRSRRSDGP